MADPFLGEIKMFGGNFAPQGWAQCDGQLLTIAQYSALFSILGTTYGGDGETTFGLPEMRGRVPVHQGTGPSLTNRPLGQKSGAEQNTLAVTNMPAHSHVLDVKLKGNSDRAREREPSGNSLAEGREDMYKTAAPDVDMHEGSIAATAAETGGGQPVNNMQPYIVVNFIIALTGVFPSPS
jgi:microcystin-dependent protein